MMRSDSSPTHLTGGSSPLAVKRSFSSSGRTRHSTRMEPLRSRTWLCSFFLFSNSALHLSWKCLIMPCASSSLMRSCCSHCSRVKLRASSASWARLRAASTSARLSALAFLCAAISLSRTMRHIWEMVLSLNMSACMASSSPSTPSRRACSSSMVRYMPSSLDLTSAAACCLASLTKDVASVIFLTASAFCACSCVMMTPFCLISASSSSTRRECDSVRDHTCFCRAAAFSCSDADAISLSFVANSASRFLNASSAARACCCSSSSRRCMSSCSARADASAADASAAVTADGLAPCPLRSWISAVKTST
mmetsp:Transcript_16086/g.34798  ORF Transcript_16086/g.34798 Transcript_16086/m.34798 type:complete len:309 (+) Transcript_16086:2389-3315(+)